MCGIHTSRTKTVLERERGEPYAPIHQAEPRIAKHRTPESSLELVHFLRTCHLRPPSRDRQKRHSQCHSAESNYSTIVATQRAHSHVAG